MLHIDSQLALIIGCIHIQDIQVTTGTIAFEELQKCAQKYYSAYNKIPLSEIKGVQHARHLFRAIGIEPTKRRPSSEALLKRAVKNKELYPVNTLVDVGNWCSLDFLLPIGIYDCDKINGKIYLRKGQKQDSYIALNNQELHLENRYVLIDDNGAFGSPITDSKRTSIETKTTNTILIIYAPIDYNKELLYNQSVIFAERVIKICGGDIKKIEILGSNKL